VNSESPIFPQTSDESPVILDRGVVPPSAHVITSTDVDANNRVTTTDHTNHDTLASETAVDKSIEDAVSPPTRVGLPHSQFQLLRTKLRKTLKAKPRTCLGSCQLLSDPEIKAVVFPV